MHANELTLICRGKRKSHLWCYLLNFLIFNFNFQDLYTTFELIVNLIFTNSSHLSSDLQYAYVSDLNNNNRSMNTSTTNKLDPKTSWPFKVTQQQHGFEHGYIFSFLNTSSIFWSSLFKLDSLGAEFSLPCASLPVST